MLPKSLHLAVLAICGMLAASSATARMGAFDGAWTVEVMTRRGACDALYHYPVAVTGNQVRFRNMYGETSPQVAGEVGRDGRIRGTFGQGENRISVAGRLFGGAGSGTWTAPGRGCSGHWTAERRD